MRKLNAVKGKRKILSLFLAAPAAYAGETSALVEKSHSQNPSQSKGTKDIQAANKAMPAKNPSKPDAGKQAGKPKVASNSFDIHIAGEYQQAKACEMLRYANQNREDNHQLQWDSELEEAAMMHTADNILEESQRRIWLPGGSWKEQKLYQRKESENCIF
ncbi:MAG: hypothetical protein HFE76_04380 [Firmicutes bacterium]|nr:hypothetical protein [Bacillota bacterium]